MCAAAQEMILIKKAIIKAADLFFLLKNNAMIGNSTKIVNKKFKARPIFCCYILICLNNQDLQYYQELYQSKSIQSHENTPG